MTIGDRDFGISIGAVSRATGIPANTLRTWERRNFIKAEKRTESGRRRYSQEQVEMLALMKKLTDSGDSISALAKLGLSSLRSRLLEYQTSETGASAARTGEIKVHTVGDHVDLWLSALPVRFRILKNEDERPDLIAIDLSATAVDCRRRVAVAKHEFPGVPLVLIYDYTTKDLIRGFSKEGHFLIRVPCSPEMFEHYIHAALANATYQSMPSQEYEGGSSANYPPRIFSDKQLATIATSNPNIKCECPHHISALVSSLASFENYCRRCENESPKDAEIHAHLGKEIAEARSIVEDALLYLCEADNLRVPSP